MSKHHQPTPAGRAHATSHLFLSYARADNLAPVNTTGEGWVNAFVNELERRDAAYSGRELKIFFDHIPSKKAWTGSADWAKACVSRGRFWLFWRPTI